MIMEIIDKIMSFMAGIIMIRFRHGRFGSDLVNCDILKKMNIIMTFVGVIIMMTMIRMIIMMIMLTMMSFRHGRFGSGWRRWQYRHWKCWSKVS